MAQNSQQAEPDLAGLESGEGGQKMSKSQKRLLAGLIIVVCLAVAAVYRPAISAKALCFDDYRYFVDNPLVRNPSLESAWKFLSEVLRPSTVGGYYQPLTMISLMLDYALVGPTDDISQFHRTSLALHVANTALIIVLLYLLFDRAWIAAAVGLLFGMHPLTVEPIPWIGERKTLLAAFFALWSLVFFVRFVRQRRRSFFWWSLGMYVLALMSKPTSTPLPVIMLLMDFWPLRRLKLASIWEKLPFFVAGGISGVITLISQGLTASVITPESYGFMRVPLVICHNIIFYPFKMLWPVNLTPHNPFPVPLDMSQPAILIGVIGTCVLIPLLFISLRWTRAALTGWLIFFLMALPTMQALQFSDVISSDKFVYLPSIGVLIILAAFLSWVCRPRPQMTGFQAKYAVVAVIVLGLATAEAVETRKYLASWRDSISLWQHMVEVKPEAAAPITNLGVAYAEKEDYNDAMAQFEKVLQFDPNDSRTYYNMGNVMLHRKKNDEAKQYFEKALQLQPLDTEVISAFGVLLIDEGKLEEAAELFRSVLAKKVEHPFLMYKGLGCVLLQMGRIDEAIKELENALKFGADSGTYSNLGIAVASKGDIKRAIKYYKKAIMMSPRDPEAHYNLGNAYREISRDNQAIAEYKAAIKANPNYIKAYGNLAVAFADMWYLDDAINNFRRVCELDPNDSNSYYNLARALVDKEEIDEAIANLRKAVELNPADASARLGLATLLLQKGRVEDAIAEYEQVLKIDPANKDAQAGLQKAREIKEKKNQPNPAPNP